MATEYTPNYNLDLYASADKPNLRDQYNAAIGKVDAQMKKTADDVTNANANVLTMQSQVSKNKEDIAALESTVETHGAQITGAQKTADDALSLAQTNETDIAGTQADVTALTGRVSAVEGVASKNKARCRNNSVICPQYSCPQPSHFFDTMSFKMHIFFPSNTHTHRNYG